jgi:hypothetical protein
LDDFFDAWWSRLKADIVVVWPTTREIVLTTQAQRSNWGNLVKPQTPGGASASFPLVLVELSQMAGGGGTGFGSSACVNLRQRVTVYYAFQPAGRNGAEELMRLLSRFLRHLFGTGQGGTCTVLEEDVAIDVSEENPLHRVLIELGIPLFAGSVSFNVILGFPIEDWPGS